MLRSSSFLNLTVCTPEMAFTTVDFPWATCPIVPIFIVACLLITSGDKAVSFVTSWNYVKSVRQSQFYSRNRYIATDVKYPKKWGYN